MRGIEAQFLALQKGFNELIPQHLLKPFDQKELEVRAPRAGRGRADGGGARVLVAPAARELHWSERAGPRGAWRGLSRFEASAYTVAVSRTLGPVRGALWLLRFVAGRVPAS